VHATDSGEVRFVDRHVGPRAHDVAKMLGVVGAKSLDALVEETVPADIRLRRPLALPAPCSEEEAIARLRTYAAENRVLHSYLGYGYHGTVTPAVIRRNILENPGWYTAYTPYQAEISQGRLEALLNFQMMVQDLTGMDVANASLLDEATAAAEAMAMAHRLSKDARSTFVVASDIHPHTLAVVRTRAEPLGWNVVVAPIEALPVGPDVFGVLLQYPGTDGVVRDPRDAVRKAHDAGAAAIVATDLLALTVLAAPGGFGADMVVGNTQRFGVPLGYGGPHAAFLATKDAHKRALPGRVIGVSKDRHGALALRMALQTREQHIRREKATSNVCTAQVLLAVIAAMYAVWHGPEGLTRIARRVHGHAATLAGSLGAAGYSLRGATFFDTVAVRTSDAGTRDRIVAAALAAGVNLRAEGERDVVVALDETVTDADVAAVLAAFGAAPRAAADVVFGDLARTTPFLTHPVFHAHRSETEMMRYLHRLEAKDLALNTAMIPLGSCTMKLNATTEMEPITWPQWGGLHPFAPVDQAKGYARLLGDLETWLAEITGFAAVSLQPNAGSQGEYAGLLVIRAYHRDRGDTHRDVCLIPTSAHGTNPASAVMAGLSVVTVKCDESGNVDVDDLRAKALAHQDRLACLMVTYPSTHGVFEARIREICAIVHDAGGQVYMDGANFNAMVGLCRPGDFGPDVCHLNLHKTFAIPHGGGGPGMGPIAMAAHLAPFRPGHPLVRCGGEKAIGPVSGAPFGSASILPIPWSYIAMLGADGLARSSQAAILAANYVAARLEGHLEVVYRGANRRVAHECIVDCRGFKDSAGISVDDLAKRLVDYGFHAPTMSFPVAGTLMIEPTESEPLSEIDRLCDALVAIRAEIRDIEEGRASREDNALVNAPHTAMDVTRDDWGHAYPRSQAAWPSPATRVHKYWPTVGRVDNVYGDKNLCTCLPVEDYA
jgi:glycine dehydrogenase